MKKPRRIVITGFMGAGKTTVAEALARRLGCRRLDLDSLIAEREGRSPAQIIAADGEAGFREIETRVLREVLRHDEAEVIALGGGTWTIGANRDLIVEQGCITIWLDAPFDLCWKRITGGGHNLRPLASDREAARKLFEQRRAVYELAGLKVKVNTDTEITEVAARIEKELDSQ